MSKVQRHILTSFMCAIYNYTKDHIIVGNTLEKNCLAMQGKLPTPHPPAFLKKFFKVKMIFSFPIWQSSDSSDKVIPNLR